MKQSILQENIPTEEHSALYITFEHIGFYVRTSFLYLLNYVRNRQADFYKC